MKDKQRMKNCPELNGVYNLVKFSGQMGFVSFRVIEIETLRSQTEHLSYKDFILEKKGFTLGVVLLLVQAGLNMFWC
jgi:hypothetical protein